MIFFNFLFLVLVVACINQKKLLPAEHTPATAIQQQITELIPDLKNLNLELKKIIGPSSEKQVAESKKKRLNKQKDSERRLKERHSPYSSGGYYPSSSHGSSYGGYGSQSYGSSGYGGSSYSPSSYGKPYSSSDFSSRSSYSPSSWSSDSGYDKGYDRQEKDQDRNTFNAESKNEDKTQEEKNNKKTRWGGEDLKKDEKSAITKIKSHTDEIEDSLKQILHNLDETYPTAQETSEAREKNYSDLLTEDDSLTELMDSVKDRKKSTHSLSKEQVQKHFNITADEKRLWHRLLPHLTRMLVFVPTSEELDPVSKENAKRIKSFIKNLEKDKLISSGSIKSCQSTVEAEIANQIKKIKSTSSTRRMSSENSNKIEDIKVRLRNFIKPIEHTELKIIITPTTNKDVRPILSTPEEDTTKEKTATDK